MPYGADVRGPIRVLYIDDDVGLGVLVQRAMSRRGHVLIHVTDSAAGFAVLARDQIDVIALDHAMAGETGIDVLARLGPRNTRPPVVYVTGSSDARTAVEAIKAGADDYVIKDMSGEFFELLVAATEQVLERWRLKRQKAESDQAVREARDRAELLLQEVNHRVANSLGLVAAMVRMQAGLLTDPAAFQALQETQARIAAIAGVHRRLYASDLIGMVEIDDYLGSLVGELRESLVDEERPYGIELTADRLTVATDKAVSIGVMVGELVTNAFKYAYGKGQSGVIRVAMTLVDRDTARLVVEDDGRGFDPAAPSAGTGLGSKILAAMALSLKAQVAQHVDGSGTRVVIDFPIA